VQRPAAVGGKIGCAGLERRREDRELDPSHREIGGTTPGLHSLRTLCRLSTMGKENRDVRISLQTLKVLEAFLENPSDPLSGAEVHQRCGLASGTLYPILLRPSRSGRNTSALSTRPSSMRIST